ncbi:hypothetical protein CAEBREN_14986 [Caenorhabditis brenneri]|uniref:Uncharacterized protein n=1 Tax=Caenorhabditis brenneri TaxID=135651 RepID=G0NSD4_CAEBE|nr:hypothetical protein CAEBREN_14986 [Caenorhabditis brenneri]
MGTTSYGASTTLRKISAFKLHSFFTYSDFAIFLFFFLFQILILNKSFFILLMILFNSSNKKNTIVSASKKSRYLEKLGQNRESEEEKLPINYILFGDRGLGLACSFLIILNVWLCSLIYTFYCKYLCAVYIWKKLESLEPKSEAQCACFSWTVTNSKSPSWTCKVPVSTSSSFSSDQEIYTRVVFSCPVKCSK